MKNDVQRRITLYPATAIVIGSVVGSGIFVSSADMAKAVGSGMSLLGVWIGGGILTLFGALSLCELAALMPKTGGLYIYLMKIYGRPAGFLYGWANFMIAGSGAVAGIAYIFALYVGEFIHLPHLASDLEAWKVHLPYLGDIFPLKDLGLKLVACSAVIFLTGLNIRGVKLGATFQSISTTIKVFVLLLLVITAFGLGWSKGSMSHFSEITDVGKSLSGWSLLAAISVALSSAFWSYDGWTNIAYIADDVVNPRRTIPRAIVLGTICFISLYVLINVAYLFILPIGNIADAPDGRVASLLTARVLGPVGAVLIAALIAFSSFDAINAVALTNARVYYAMAHANMFWKRAGTIHPRFETPYIALILQGIWCLVLLITGTYDILIKMFVFVNWLIYSLIPLGVFILRKKDPHSDRAFRVPGYPWTPAVFMLFASLYVVVTLINDIQAYRLHHQDLINSVVGLILVCMGLPLYWLWNKPESATLDMVVSGKPER